jgi:hypothetical protein
LTHERSQRFTVYTADEKPELLSEINELSRRSFPLYLFEGDPPIRDYWDSMMERYPPFQFALFEGEEMVGGGVTVPLKWNGNIKDLPSSFETILTNLRQKSPASTSGEMNGASDEGGVLFPPLASLTT